MAKSKGNSPQDETRRVKKEKSREKEYRRSQSINGAFDTLQQRIPYLRPEERKHLPKIKTLRLAMQYITHLSKLLEGNEMANTESNETRPLTHSDFRFNVTNEMRVRNSYRERAHSQEMDQATVQRILSREENRRRCTSIPDDIQGYLAQQPRQFGPISSNVYNFRQMQSNHFDTNYVAYHNPMMMMMSPYSPMANTENHVGYHQIPMDMSNSFMLQNTWPQ